MDAEHPTSPRHLLGRVAATLLALVVLYPLSAGPVVYLAEKLRADSKVTGLFYEPLHWAIIGTPLEQPYVEYVYWWLRLAGGHPGK